MDGIDAGEALDFLAAMIRFKSYSGEPGETEETVDQKLRFLTEIKPAFAVLRVGGRVLPGTSIARLSMEEGLIESDSDLLEPTFYVEPAVRDWLPERLQDEAAAHPRWNVT